MVEVTVEGQEGIKAKVICDSVSSVNEKRITTFELEYPRFIHSELMTHRVFSRNAASSRAVPITKMLKMVWDNPAIPVHWGANQKGMQANNALPEKKRKLARGLWKAASKIACASSYALYKVGLHKQLVNRLTETFQRYKVVLTTTEIENWFWLRDHQDAQPETRELAKCMMQAMDVSTPQVLKPGEWHLPYVETHRSESGNLGYLSDGDVIELKTALKLSSSCCAQVSYRTLNQSVGTAENIYKKLVVSEPPHLSPFEHQATPMETPEQNIYEGKVFIEDGMTHIDVNMDAWSGNLKGWIQHRQLLDQ